MLRREDGAREVDQGLDAGKGKYQAKGTDRGLGAAGHRESADVQGRRVNGGMQQPQEAGGPTAWGGGPGREGPGNRRAVTSTRDWPIRSGKGAARPRTCRAARRGGERATAAGPAGRRDARLCPGDSGGRGGGRGRSRGACSEPAGSAGGKLALFLPPPLLHRVSPGSVPRPRPLPPGRRCASRSLPAARTAFSHLRSLARSLPRSLLFLLAAHSQAPQLRRAFCFLSPGRSSNTCLHRAHASQKTV